MIEAMLWPRFSGRKGRRRRSVVEQTAITVPDDISDAFDAWAYHSGLVGATRLPCETRAQAPVQMPGGDRDVERDACRPPDDQLLAGVPPNAMT